MDKDKAEIEMLCLETIHTIDSLRTKLFANEDFHDFEVWNKRLSKLKRQLKHIYWSA